jgi:hypothetical protein
MQRSQRVLEDHADLRATGLAHLLLGRLKKVVTLEDDLALYPRLFLGYEAQDGQHAHALAGPRLPHHAQGLAALHGERDPVNRLDQPVVRGEVDLEILHLQERLGH